MESVSSGNSAPVGARSGAGPAHVPALVSETALPQRLKDGTIKSLTYLGVDVVKSAVKPQYIHRVFVKTLKAEWMIERTSSAFKHCYLHISKSVPSLLLPQLAPSHLFGKRKRDLENRRANDYKQLLTIIETNIGIQLLSWIQEFLDIPNHIFPELVTPKSAVVYLCAHSAVEIEGGPKSSCRISFSGLSKHIHTLTSPIPEPLWLGEYVYFSNEVDFGRVNLDLKVKVHNAGGSSKVGVAQLTPAWLEPNVFYDLTIPLAAASPGLLRIWIHVQPKEAPAFRGPGEEQLQPHKLTFFKSLPLARSTVINRDCSVTAGSVVTALVKYRHNPPEIAILEGVDSILRDISDIGFGISCSTSTAWSDQEQNENGSHNRAGARVLAKVGAFLWRESDLDGPNDISPGIYAWPIQFTVPESAPATLGLSRSSKFRAKIDYNISVGVRSHGHAWSYYQDPSPFNVLAPVISEKADAQKEKRKIECENRFFSAFVEAPKCLTVGRPCTVNFTFVKWERPISTIYVYFVQTVQLTDDAKETEEMTAIMTGAQEVKVPLETGISCQIEVFPTEEKPILGGTTRSFPDVSDQSSPIISVRHYLAFSTEKPDSEIIFQSDEVHLGMVKVPVTLGYPSSSHASDFGLLSSWPFPFTEPMHGSKLRVNNPTAFSLLEPMWPIDKLTRPNMSQSVGSPAADIEMETNPTFQFENVSVAFDDLLK